MSRVAMVAIWLLCLVAATVALVWMLAALLVGSERAWRLARAFDRVGNAATGGDDAETISQRAWRWRHERGWACVLVALVEAVDPDHFADSTLYPRG